MRVYADNASTTIVDKIVIESMITHMESIYGNPSSRHLEGMRAKDSICEARKVIANCIGAEDCSEIVFTSGGTESNNQAILSAAMIGVAHGKKHIITSTFEHPSVMNTLLKLKKMDFDISYIGVGSNGIVDLSKLETSIRPDTCLVSIMTINNEIGTIQPIETIGKLCREKSILFHTDAVQAIGHIELDVQTLNVDLLTASAHKFHGPKGIGFLYVRTGYELTRCFEGGHQERQMRPGTENVPGIVGMAVALKKSINHMEANTNTISLVSSYLVENLKSIPYSRLNGDIHNKFPGIMNYTFEGIEGERLVLELDKEGIAVSTGSSCMSGEISPSHVLLSLGMSEKLALCSIRISISENNTIDEMQYLAEKIKGIVIRVRESSIKWKYGKIHEI